MRKNCLYCLFLLPVITLVSCDCMQIAKGVVCDKESRKPLENVKVIKIQTEHEVFTEKEGSFNIHAISGGFCGCPPMKIVLTKEGYETLMKESIYDKNDTIFMSKQH